MNTIEFIVTFLYFMLFSLSSISIGYSIQNIIKKILHQKIQFKTSIHEFGISILIGIGILGYIGLIIGFLGLFSKEIILIVLLIGILLQFKYLFKIVMNIIKGLKFTKNIKLTNNFITYASIIFSVLIAASLYLTALQPPYTADELHYHLPEVREIVIAEKINLNFGGHPFYGNIPKLMEVIFAMGSSVNGYGLTHLLNYLILTGFILIVFGLLNKHYNTKVASIATVLLLMFDDFTWNATSGYIDSATTAMEIGSLLLILDWFISKNKNSFFLSAILLGIGLSFKYSPLPTALFILLLIFIKFIIQNKKFTVKNVKKIIIFIFLSSLLGGFWYIKNLILYKNPFYPLYFGHVGYPEESYISLVDAIQEFGPKTISYYFELTKRYLTINGVFVFMSIYLAPLILFIKEKKKFHNILLIFFILYNFYWFFFATHQIRFLGSALVVSLILLAITLKNINKKHFAYLITIMFLVGLVSYHTIYKFDYLFTIKSIFNTKFHLRERQYGLGNITKDEFLHREFGCQYDIVKYLKDNNITDKVIDNWSVWHAPSVSFYANEGQFITYGSQENETDVEIYKGLIKNNIIYLYYRDSVREKHLANPDILVIKNVIQKLPVEEVFYKNSSILYQVDDCKLLKFSPK